jgi:plastocyanin
MTWGRLRRTEDEPELRLRIGGLGPVSVLGVVLFVFSAGFPLFDDATEVDLTIHMLQHVLIVLSGTLVAYPLFKKRMEGAKVGGVLPAASLLSAATAVVFWHLPGPWDDAVVNPAVHVVEHLSFFAVGLLCGSFVLLLTDSGKIGALLLAFFGHMGYAAALILDTKGRVYALYSVPNQTVLGWVLLLTGPTLVVGIAYVIVRNPGWLGSAGPAQTVARRETFLNKVRIPGWAPKVLSGVLAFVFVGYLVAAVVAVGTSSPAAVAGSSTVYIEETPVSWQYSPQNITVVLGVNSTVVWVSHSISYDTVTDRAGRFDSGPIQPGQTFQLAFTSPGVYDYYCAYHPWMVGKVVVKSP